MRNRLRVDSCSLLVKKNWGKLCDLRTGDNSDKEPGSATVPGRPGRSEAGISMEDDDNGRTGKEKNDCAIRDKAKFLHLPERQVGHQATKE